MPWHVGPITVPNPFEPLPRLWQNLNVITQIIEENCSPSWTVYIETAIPASKHAVLFLISPDLTQIVQNYLRPGGRAGGGKLRLLSPGRWLDDGGHRKRKHFGGGIPDADSLIADRIPGRAYFGQRVAGKVEGWVWKGIDVLDRVGWYWMLAYAAEDFTTEWISGIMQSKFCSSHFTAFASGHGSPLYPTTTGLILPSDDRATWDTRGGWFIQSGQTLARPPRGAKGRAIITCYLRAGRLTSGSQTSVFRIRAEAYYPTSTVEYGSEFSISKKGDSGTSTLTIDFDASIGIQPTLERVRGNLFFNVQEMVTTWTIFAEAK